MLKSTGCLVQFIACKANNQKTNPRKKAEYIISFLTLEVVCFVSVMFNLMHIVKPTVQCTFTIWKMHDTFGWQSKPTLEHKQLSMRLESVEALHQSHCRSLSPSLLFSSKKHASQHSEQLNNQFDKKFFVEDKSLFYFLSYFQMNSPLLLSYRRLRRRKNRWNRSSQLLCVCSLMHVYVWAWSKDSSLS